MAESSEAGRRLIIVLAGLLGAVGIAASAAASHTGESRNLSAIAVVALAHAPTLLALGFWWQGRVLKIAGGLLALGTLMFTADLGVREWLGQGLFPGAAPLGGAGMILGWLGVSVAAVLWRKPR